MTQHRSCISWLTMSWKYLTQSQNNPPPPPPPLPPPPPPRHHYCSSSLFCLVTNTKYQISLCRRLWLGSRHLPGSREWCCCCAVCVPDGCCCAPLESAGPGHQGPPQGIPSLRKERKERKRKEKKRKDHALRVLVLVIMALLKVFFPNLTIST